MDDRSPHSGAPELSRKERVRAERGALRRVFRYIFCYKFRLAAGALLALLVSFTNLFSLTALIPIFNVMGAESAEEIRLFEIGGDQARIYNQWKDGVELETSYAIQAQVTDWQVRANEAIQGMESSTVVAVVCAIILPVYLLKMLCITGTIFFVGTAGLLAVRDIRIDLYDKMNRLGMDYFQRERTGIVMSRVVNDVEVVGKSLSVEFNEALINIFYIVTHLALLAYISWEMFLITFVFVPVLTAPVSKFATRIRRAYAGQQERLAELGGHIQEVISGIRVIRAFSMEGFEKERFARTNQRLYQNTFLGHYFHQVGPALTEITATVVVVVFLVWGAYQITEAIESSITLGEFFAFFFTLVFVMRPIKQMSIMVNLLASARAAALRIFDMMDQPPGVENPEHPRPMPPVAEAVEYDSVSFRYPGSEAEAVHAVSFRAPAGTTTALVGSSGAGKSTLMDLLPRFYDVSSGAIRIDGTDLRDLDLKQLRTSIGAVSQDVFLFNATIRENIAYGRPDADAERLEAASRAANAHEFIEKLPVGYDTPIGERGVMLSGGQRQRIAIARALLQDPPILIFDEATSALDNESELLVQQAIERLLQGRTVFVIAHRLSTIYKSDQILVLDQGRIAEQGVHEELLERGGIYKKLYEMQFAE